MQRVLLHSRKTNTGVPSIDASLPRQPDGSEKAAIRRKATRVLKAKGPNTPATLGGKLARGLSKSNKVSVFPGNCLHVLENVFCRMHAIDPMVAFSFFGL